MPLQNLVFTVSLEVILSWTCLRPSWTCWRPCAFTIPNGVWRQATYPLDTLRLRLAVDPASRSVMGAARALMREGSHRAFFRGLGASMLGAWIIHSRPSSCC